LAPRSRLEEAGEPSTLTLRKSRWTSRLSAITRGVGTPIGAGWRALLVSRLAFWCPNPKHFAQTGCAPRVKRKGGLQGGWCAVLCCTAVLCCAVLHCCVTVRHPHRVTTLSCAVLYCCVTVLCCAVLHCCAVLLCYCPAASSSYNRVVTHGVEPHSIHRKVALRGTEVI